LHGTGGNGKGLEQKRPDGQGQDQGDDQGFAVLPPQRFGLAAAMTDFHFRLAFPNGHDLWLLALSQF